jgi:hypothetical protein
VGVRSLPLYLPLLVSLTFLLHPTPTTGSDYIASPSDDFFAYTGKKTMMVDALLKGVSVLRSGG